MFQGTPRVMQDPSESSCRIVICDDTPGIRMLLTAMLSAQSGIAVVGEAENGRQAVDVASQLRPDVMLLDISMPVMDGMEALPLIRQASPTTSVVMLSGFSASEIKDRALSEGAVAYVEKGIDFEVIVATLRQHCKDGNAS